MKILIIKLSSLGDLVHALPAANLLRKFLPAAQIDWLCYKNYADIFQDIKTINKLIILEDKKISTLQKTLQKINKEKYDYVIDFQGLIKTSLLAFFSGAESYGFKNPRESLASSFYRFKFEAAPTLKNKRHVVLQNLDLAKFFLEKTLNKKIAIDDSLIEFFDKEKLLIREGQTIKKFCIIPSTTWQSKLWTVASWIELINYIHGKYNSEIFILGTLNDMTNIEPIISQLRVPFHFVSSKKLSELADFFLEMDLVVGVDTGPLHIAAATLYPYRKNSHKRVIGIYGPSSGSRTGPYGFEYLSYDEVFKEAASNKKTIAEDKASMAKLSTDLLQKIL